MDRLNFPLFWNIFHIDHIQPLHVVWMNSPYQTEISYNKIYNPRKEYQKETQNVCPYEVCCLLRLMTDVRDILKLLSILIIFKIHSLFSKAAVNISPLGKMIGLGKGEYCKRSRLRISSARGRTAWSISCVPDPVLVETHQTYHGSCQDWELGSRQKVIIRIIVDLRKNNSSSGLFWYYSLIRQAAAELHLQHLLPAHQGGDEDKVGRVEALKLADGLIVRVWREGFDQRESRKQNGFRFGR